MILNCSRSKLGNVRSLEYSFIDRFGTTHIKKTIFGHCMVSSYTPEKGAVVQVAYDLENPSLSTAAPEDMEIFNIRKEKGNG